MSPTKATSALPLRGAKVSLGFGLVNIPVAMKPLAETQRPVPGKGMCPDHGPTLSQVSVCSKGEPGEHLVPNDEKQTGYPHPDNPDRLVVVDQATWKALEESRSGQATITAIVDADTIDAAYVNKTYMVWPQPGHEQAFDLLAAMLDADGKAAVTTTVLSKQSSVVVFRFSSEFGCMVAHTVKYEQELRYREVQMIADAAKERPDVDEKALEAGRALLNTLAGEFDAGEAQDVLTTLRHDAIRAVAEGQEPAIAVEAEPAPTAADDLVATLLASVPESKPAKKKAPAKKAAAKAKVAA